MHERLNVLGEVVEGVAGSGSFGVAMSALVDRYRVNSGGEQR